MSTLARIASLLFLTLAVVAATSGVRLLAGGALLLPFVLALLTLSLLRASTGFWRAPLLANPDEER
ncbi:MAG: hypothetical protein ACI81R_000106 [Bradymonadia bacterium]|jgi:hypothetical protein